MRRVQENIFKLVFSFMLEVFSFIYYIQRGEKLSFPPIDVTALVASFSHTSISRSGGVF